MRSGQNYPHLLAQQLNAELTDLTVSGATLLNITVDPQTVLFSKETFPVQISNLPEDADIITITAGGNDINYIGGMLYDAWVATLPGAILNTIIQCVRALTSAVSSQPPAQTSDPLSPSEMAVRLGGVLDKIHKRAPRARIFVVEYLAVLGPDTRHGQDIPFNQEKLEHHRGVASALQQAYAVAAEGRGNWCERVPVHELSQGHALGSKEPWVGGFDLASVVRRGPIFHPNLDGMKAVASLLLGRVQNDRS
jgi:lysophospholipase L1-like esterase